MRRHRQVSLATCVAEQETLPRLLAEKTQLEVSTHMTTAHLPSSCAPRATVMSVPPRPLARLSACVPARLRSSLGCRLHLATALGPAASFVWLPAYAQYLLHLAASFCLGAWKQLLRTTRRQPARRLPRSKQAVTHERKGT